MVSTNTVTYAGLAGVLNNLTIAITTAAEGLDFLKKIEFEASRQEVRILEDIVDTIKPVIRYLDKPYVVKKVVSSNRRFYEEYEELHERAIVLIETHGWRRRRTDNGFESYYQGYSLLLTRSGDFVKLTFTGGKDTDSGSYTREAEVNVLSAQEVLERYWYNDILNKLADTFRQALRDIDRRKYNLERRLKVIESAIVSWT